jgi:ankyrin repeat protein
MTEKGTGLRADAPLFVPPTSRIRSSSQYYQSNQKNEKGNQEDTNTKRLAPHRDKDKDKTVVGSSELFKKNQKKNPRRRNGIGKDEESSQWTNKDREKGRNASHNRHKNISRRRQPKNKKYDSNNANTDANAKNGACPARMSEQPTAAPQAAAKLPSPKNTQTKRQSSKHIKSSNTTSMSTCRTRNRRGRHNDLRQEESSPHNKQQQPQENEMIINSLALLKIKESSFPSLVEAPNQTTERQRPIDTTSQISKLWQSSSQNFDLFQPPPSGADDKVERDYFSRLGLQKLTSQTTTSSKAIRKQATSVAEDVLETDECPIERSVASRNHSYLEHHQEQRLDGRTEETTEQEPIPRQRRPKINMDRLRDKWWDALAQRKVRRALLTELQLQLEDRIVDPDLEEAPFSSDDSLSSSTTTTTTTTSNSETQADALVDMHDSECEAESPGGETKISALQALVENSSKEESSTALGILQQAVENNDDEALKELLEFWNQKSRQQVPQCDAENPTSWIRDETDLLVKALHLTVQQDKPLLLRTILLTHGKDLVLMDIDRRTSNDHTKESGFISPLMQAAELGHEECLSLLLTRQDRTVTLLSLRDAHGNNVFHYSCRGKGNESILRMLLKKLSGGTKAKHQQLSKVLLVKNDSHQTPLHVACEQGRVDLVEMFLSTCSTAVLSKLLAIEDDRQQTPLLAAVAANAADVVMCLIMWRGNHNLILRKTPQAPRNKLAVSGVDGITDKRSRQKLPPCPLVWAARHGNLDMLLLLLQFSDPSFGDYRITEAISALLLSAAPYESKSEGVYALIQDGGNPFLESVPFDGAGGGETAVGVAAKSSSPAVLGLLVETGRGELEGRQQQRRRDPRLRQQPEAFFEAMECKENSEMKKALTNALVECLYYGWDKFNRNDELVPCHLAAAVTLYNLSARLEEKDRARLQISMHAGTLKSELQQTEDQRTFSCFVASYQHFTDPSYRISKLSDIDRSALAQGSHLICQMEWMGDEMQQSACCCPWLSDKWTGNYADKDLQNVDQVVLIVDDGTRFVVHSSILSQKSAKLASAVRFAKMNQPESRDESPEIQVAISSRLCKWMLQHIYHGSIACGWSRGREQNHHEILELMLIAEEFLCHSLIQECEMRLLSSDPTACFCWSCAKAVRCHSEKKRLAECVYVVDGPSRLLMGHSVLDVLAVLQHFESMEVNYNISAVPLSLCSLKCMPATKTWGNMNGVWTSHRAVGLLKETAIVTILTKFSEVIRSGSFQESAALNKESDVSGYEMSQQALLLQMCLEELSKSPLPKAYRGYGNGHPKGNALV